VASPPEAKLLHGLPLRRHRLVTGELYGLLGFSDEAQLGVDVEVRAFSQRLAGLDGFLQDETLPF
jgi:hypothetical protein